MRKSLPFALVVLLGLAVDLVTKWLAFRALGPGQFHVVIPDVLVFDHAENHGVAFSMLAGHPGVIIALTSFALVFLVWLYFKTRETAHGLAITALALLLIGAAGNLIDRIALGYVRDFIDFVPPIPFIGHWAIFNVADVAITVGVTLYAISEIFFAPKDENVAST